MTYNPHSFENIYGFSLLDEIHNFFPELLYDDGIFPNDSLRWMRHRIHRLFPQAYTRQQNMYNIYSAEPRLRDYLQWYRENLRLNDMPNFEMREPILVPNIASPPPPRQRYDADTVPTRVSVDMSGAPQPAATRQRRATMRTSNNAVPALFTSLLWDIREPRDPIGEGILNIFNQALIDVAVAPSAAQIQGASRIEDANTIPEETNCSICQEHGEQVAWRILNCGHSYHQQCIDMWFASHTQCPICRADVRSMLPQT
jgi:hypothetical protein